MKYVFYKHTNIVNGKSYIGITSRTMKIRFDEHLNNAKRGMKTHFYRALRKYGIDNFKSEVLYEGYFKNKADAFSKEKELIEKYNTCKNGYNMTKGGDNPPYNKNKIMCYKNYKIKYIKPEDKSYYLNKGWNRGNSSTKKYIWANDGQTEFKIIETDLKDYNKGRIYDTPERIKNRNYKGTNNPFFNKTHTKEVKNKLKELKSKGLYITPKGTFISSSDAAKHNSCSDVTIINRSINNNDKIIKGNQHTPNNWKNKSLKELGWYFVAK